MDHEEKEPKAVSDVMLEKHGDAGAMTLTVHFMHKDEAKTKAFMLTADQVAKLKTAMG